MYQHMLATKFALLCVLLTLLGFILWYIFIYFFKLNTTEKADSSLVYSNNSSYQKGTAGDDSKSVLRISFVQ